MKNYKKKKMERTERNKSILELNNTYTNIPEISEALAWSQLSLDALLTGEIGRGIWAGIPGLNEYFGRESFMSFSGALLVNGQFNEAKEFFNYFGKISAYYSCIGNDCVCRFNADFGDINIQFD